MKTKAKLSHRFYYMALTAIAVAAPSPQLLADDTDVFFAINEETYVDNKPNIMFIMDNNYTMVAPGQFTFDETNCSTEVAWSDASGKPIYCKDKIKPHKCNDKGEMMANKYLGDLRLLYCDNGKKIIGGVANSCNDQGQFVDSHGAVLMCEDTLKGWKEYSCNAEGVPLDSSGNPLKSPDVHKRYTSTKSCYVAGDNKYKKNPSQNMCYDDKKWYYLPNNDLSRVMDYKNNCPISTDGTKNTWNDAVAAATLRVDRPLDSTKNHCSDLQFAIDTKGGRSGYFAGLYKRRCDAWAWSGNLSDTYDSDGQSCSWAGGTEEYGWYPLDLVRRAEQKDKYGEGYIPHNGLGGLNNPYKIEAIECLEDMGTHGQMNDTSTPPKVYVASGNNAAMDPQNPLAKGWTADENQFVKQPFEFGGIYSGHYLNYLRSNTKLEKKARKDIFTTALKRFIERSNNIRLGLASFKPYKFDNTSCLNGGRGEGAADIEDDNYIGRTTLLASNDARCDGGGDGGSIDVPIVDIETVHEKWRWLPDMNNPNENPTHRVIYTPALWKTSKRNFGTKFYQDYAEMNRDVSHREWLWHQVDQYFTMGYSSGGHTEYPVRTELSYISDHNIPGIGKKKSFPLTMNSGSQSLGTKYRPLGETLFEVGRYFRGESPKFGAYSRPETWTDISYWGGALDTTKRKEIWHCEQSGQFNCFDGSGDQYFGPWGPIYDYPRWTNGWWLPKEWAPYTDDRASSPAVTIYGFKGEIDHHRNNKTKGDSAKDPTRPSEYNIPDNISTHYQSPIRAVRDESGNVNADPCEANVAVIFTDYTGETTGNSASDMSSVKISFTLEDKQRRIVDGVRTSRRTGAGLLPPFDDDDEGPLMQRLWPGLNCQPDIDKYGTCMPAIAGYLANNDLASHVDGKQVLRTFVVSYWNDNQFQGREPLGVEMLRETAKRGKGKFIRFGSSLAELDKAISEIMNISALNPIGAGTFVAPASTVDFSNRLENKEDVYFSLFEPSETDRWQGNVKRYKLGYVGSEPTVVSATCNVKTGGTNCESIIDAKTNSFKAAATSGWGAGTQVDDTTADGSDVSKKGAVAKQHVGRNVLTDYCWNPSKASGPLDKANDSCFKVDSLNKEQLQSLARRFSIDVPSSLLADPSDNSKPHKLLQFYVKNKIAYLQGYAGDYNAKGTVGNQKFEQRIGDPLHSQPKFVHYGLNAQKEPNQSVIFFGTNEGYVHAIDVANGEELFAFAPEAAFGAIGRYHDNEVSQPGKKVYGVDGEIETWLNDTNGNGVLDGDEKAYIFFGMRRGGDTYYALDVTDPTAPKLAWRFTSTPYEKNGGKNGQSYHELAQSWAKPVLIKAKPWLPEVKNTNGTKMSAFSDSPTSDGKREPRTRAVLVMTAGYDASQDIKNTLASDRKGRAIYLVDALTGVRLWAAGYAEKASNTNTALTSLTDQSAYDVELPDMKYSLAATPAVFDVDGDTYVDTIIAADTGGQIWRVNLQPKEPIMDGGKITGYQAKEPTVELVAQLANNGGTTARPSADRRRFFTTPDLMFDRTDRSLVIAIGTGRRPKPLDKSVDNRLYVLRAKVSQEYSTNPKVNTTTNKYEIGQAKTLTEADLFDITDKNSFKTAENRTNYFTNGLMLKLGTTYLNGATVSSCERNTGTTASGRVISSRVNCKNEGEKIMDNVSIFNNHVIFTSYLPSRIPEFCGAALGDNRFNAISLANPDARDSIALNQHGIAPKPAVMLINDGGERKPAIVVGTEVVKPTDIKSAGLKNLYTLSRDKLIKMWLER